MAVTTDLVHNIGDIHPIDKIDVGNRLALWALAKEFGRKDLVYSGPLYKSMKIEGNKIRLSFAQVGGGLKLRDGKPLSEFTIAGADGKFVPAQAAIDGKTVVVQASGWRAGAGPVRLAQSGQSQTWSTRRACPPRHSRPTTGRAARGSEGGRIKDEG